MSLLRSLFNRSDEPDKDDKDRDTDGGDDHEDADDRPSGKPAPKLVKGMDLVVTYADTGKMLLSGRIQLTRSREITLERSPGAFAFEMCQPGTQVYVRGYVNTGPVDMKGVVKLSTRIQFVVGDLELVDHDELRSNFRLPLSVPVNLYYQDDVRMQNPERCTLVNISTGGACVDSEFIHADGEILRMKMQIEDYAPMSFLGQVIRVEEPKPGLFRYGFLFAQLDTQEANMLTRLLFNLQVGNRKKWERDRNTGAWI